MGNSDKKWRVFTAVLSAVALLLIGVLVFGVRYSIMQDRQVAEHEALVARTEQWMTENAALPGAVTRAAVWSDDLTDRALLHCLSKPGFTLAVCQCWLDQMRRTYPRGLDFAIAVRGNDRPFIGRRLAECYDAHR